MEPERNSGDGEDWELGSRQSHQEATTETAHRGPWASGTEPSPSPSPPLPRPAWDIHPLVHNLDHNLIICCRSIRSINEIPKHLKTEHKVSQERRRAIVGLLEKVPGLLQTEADIETMELPEKLAKPVTELGHVITNGLRCKVCKFIATAPKIIKQHLNTKHN